MPRVQSLFALTRSRWRLATFSVARVPPVRRAPCGLAMHPAVLGPPSKDLGHGALGSRIATKGSTLGEALEPIKDARKGRSEGVADLRVGKALLNNRHPRPTVVLAVEGDLYISWEVGSVRHRRYGCEGQAARSINHSEPVYLVVGRAQIGYSLPAVSQHLSVLKRRGLVSSWRLGRSVLYQRTALATGLLAASQSDEVPVRRFHS